MKWHSWRFAVLLALLLFQAGLCETGFLVIYSEPPAAIKDSSGRDLGTSGKPFSTEQIATDGKEVVFVLVAEGYQEQRITIQKSELETLKRLPAQGRYRLSRRGGLPSPWLGLPVVLVVGWLFWRRRKPKSPLGTGADEDFQLGRLLGEGGTSKIYEGTAPGLETESIAVKVMDISDSGMAARFLRSLKSTLALDHPYLVKIYRSGTTSMQQPYLIMEKLEGRDLKAALKRESPLEASRILEILEPICLVLHYLHQSDVVHRDVKPENIFLCQNGGVKLMDLEISRAADAEDLTATGVAVGTPYYIAPEQARGLPCSQSDQYSVGIILFEMLFGQPPFTGPNSMDVLNMHLKEPVPYIDGATGLQNAVIQKLTSKNPQNRFSDMSEALEAIKDALGERDQEQTGTVY